MQTWRSRPEQNVAADGPGTAPAKRDERRRRESRARSSQTQRQPPPHSKAERIDQQDEPRKRTQTQNEPSERPQTSFLVLNIIDVMLNYEISSVESLPVWAFQPAFPIRRHRRLNPGLQVFFRASYTDLPAVNPPHRSSLKRTPQLVHRFRDDAPAFFRAQSFPSSFTNRRTHRHDRRFRRHPYSARDFLRAGFAHRP